MTTRSGDEDIRDAVAVLRSIGRLLARFVVEGLQDGDTVSQQGSRLGSRKHRAAVKRRMAEYALGKRDHQDAWIVGRDYLMTRAALEEEMARPSVAKAQPSARAAKNAELDAFQRELGDVIRLKAQ